jgi:DNA-binding response OmpR family regulator
MKILIADDDRMSTLMLARALESWGFEVISAHDGQSAWDEIVRFKEPALAIVDWMMPGLSGIDLCRRVRSTALAAPIYVILLTAKNERQDLVAGLEAGADDYLTKPFDPDELRARIHVGHRTLAYISNIKRLTGLLPICSYCKSVRSDQNYWEQVESYISEHTDVRFSHGICPTCLQKVVEEHGLDMDDPAPGA